MKVTRAKLEQLVRPIVEKTAGPIEQALKDAQLTPNGHYYKATTDCKHWDDNFELIKWQL